VPGARDRASRGELAFGTVDAWLIWHLTRIQDDHVAELAGRAQIWKEDGWVERFDLPLDPADTGYGHGPDESAKVVADAAKEGAQQVAVAAKGVAHDVAVATQQAAQEVAAAARQSAEKAKAAANKDKTDKTKKAGDKPPQ